MRDTSRVAKHNPARVAGQDTSNPPVSDMADTAGQGSPNAAEWTVPPEHPALKGHFPAHPVVPGVVLLDHTIRRAGPLPPGQHWCIVQAKFLQPVLPGETLLWSSSPAANGCCRWTIRVGQTIVARVVLQRAPA